MRPLLFIHIPKSGGTTIRAVLNKHIVAFSGEDHHTGITKEHIAKYRGLYKFAFVRSPWRRLASMYRNNKLDCERKHENFPYDSFRHYVELLPGGGHPMYKNQLDFICIDGKIAIDFIGRYENYLKDLKTLCDKFNINAPVNRRLRYFGDYNYLDYYNDELVKLVGEHYSRDIEHFNYKFGD